MHCCPRHSWFCYGYALFTSSLALFISILTKYSLMSFLHQIAFILFLSFPFGTIFFKKQTVIAKINLICLHSHFCFMLKYMPAHIISCLKIFKFEIFAVKMIEPLLTLHKLCCLLPIHLAICCLWNSFFERVPV